MSKIKVGKKIEAISIKNTIILSGDISLKNNEWVFVPEGELLTGKVLSVSETEIRILTPDGIEKVFTIIDFIVNVIQLIEQLIVVIRDFFKSLKKAK